MSHTEIDIRAKRGYELGVVLDAFLDGDFGDYVDLRQEEGAGSSLAMRPTTVVRVLAVYAGELSEEKRAAISAAVKDLTDGAVSIVFSLKDGTAPD